MRLSFSRAIPATRENLAANKEWRASPISGVIIRRAEFSIHSSVTLCVVRRVTSKMSWSESYLINSEECESVR